MDQPACDPDELLGKRPCSCEICPRDSKGDSEDKSKKDDGIGIERETVRRMVYAAAAKMLVRRITIKR